MRLRSITIAALSIALLAGTAGAQTLATRKALTLDAAKAMAAACVAFAKGRNETINVWIFDLTGNPIYFERMDGAAIVGMETARRKGWTALRAGMSSGEADKFFASAGPSGGLLAIQSDWMGNPGGVPVIVDGQLIGAVGAGGMGQQPDEDCAQTAANVVIPANQRPARRAAARPPQAGAQ